MTQIPKWLVVTVGTLLAIFLAVLAANQLNALVGWWNPAGSPAASAHTISITAEGKIDAIPDLAIANGSVVLDGTTAQQVKDESSQKINSVLSAVKALGVEDKDIQTTNFSISQKYKYPANGSPTPDGYTANQTLAVKIRNLDNVGKVIDVMTANGINQVGNVSYTFADPDAVREQARELALTNARQRAEKLTAIAGAHLGKLISFNEGSGYVPGPIPYAVGGTQAMDASVPAKVDSSPVIDPGTQSVTEDITVLYELK